MDSEDQDGGWIPGGGVGPLKGHPVWVWEWFRVRGIIFRANGAQLFAKKSNGGEISGEEAKRIRDNKDYLLERVRIDEVLASMDAARPQKLRLKYGRGSGPSLPLAD